MKRLSIIIVWNKEALLSEAKEYLEKQTFKDFELIALDNHERRFASAAAALNYGAENAEGDVLVFMHQDIFLWDEAALAKIYDFVCTHRDCIVGAAGVAKTDGKIYFDMCENKTKMIRRGTSIKATGSDYIEAVTLDECIFAMSKEKWQKLRFDENVCSDWHMYGVDICYENIIGGGQNFILSLDICHDSLGNSTGNGYKKTLKKVVKKYKGRLERITSTCCNIKCNTWGYIWYDWRKKLVNIKHKIFGNKKSAEMEK